MSSDLDKFVLQYTVELKDSIKKLEELQKKMSAVSQTHKESAGQLKAFVSGASDELGKLIPGVNAVSTAVRSMGGAFALAGVGVTAFAVSVKAVMDLRQQLNRQRLLGMDLGIGGAQLDDLERKFVRASAGSLTTEQAGEEFRKIRQMGYAAYANPGGVEARRFQKLGIDPGKFGSPTGFMDKLGDLGKKVGGMSAEETQALAQTTGLSQDWLEALRLLGPELTKVSELTLEEFRKRKQAEKEMDELNKHINDFEQALKNLSNRLAMDVLPVFTKVLEKISGVISWAKKVKPDTGPGSENFGGLAGWLSGATMDLWERGKYRFKNRNNPDAPSYDQAMGLDKDPMTEAERRLLEAEIKADNKRNEEAGKRADREKAIIDQFGASVATFSGTISQGQAWAAWAGEVGKAGGLRSSSNSPGAASGPARSSGGSKVPSGVTDKYDAFIQEAADKYGLDPVLLKQIIAAESNFDPNATSKAGAVGLMQIMPEHVGKFGLQDRNDPRQNIMAGAAIFAQNLKRFGNRDDALRAYNGGWDPKRWGNKETAAYADRVNSQRVSIGGGGPVAGQGRADLQLFQVQSMLAQRLGVDIEQIQHGKVSRGDVGYASQQIQAGLQNNIAQLRNKAAGSAGKVSQQEYAAMLRDIKAQEMGLSLMQQYAPGVVGSARPGERERTIGQFNVTIQINGAGDSDIVAQKVHDVIREEVLRSLNMSYTGTKG